MEVEKDENDNHNSCVLETGKGTQSEVGKTGFGSVVGVRTEITINVCHFFLSHSGVMTAVDKPVC